MTDAALTVNGYTIKPLGPDTWEAFADLAERHNGVWGGCFCTWFHPRRKDQGIDVEAGRPYKELLVREGRAHAALVFDGEVAVAWCQYGSPEELPNIYHRKEYDATSERPPDYRITCIFVDRAQRHAGVSDIALRGALDLIARDGGGLVEGYPHDNQGKKVSVLYSGTRALFERAGFVYDRPKGTRNCVMRKQVEPA